MKSSQRSTKWTTVEAYESAREDFGRMLNAAGRRYMSEFIGLKCAPDLLARGLFPNAKEITESSAAYHATRYLPEFNLSDPQTTVYVVGDGMTPRTAAFFAFRSAWWCHSIDPKLQKVDWDTYRLTVHQSRIEDAPVTPARWKRLLVAVHSHADLQVAADKTKPHAVIAIPCCVHQRLHQNGHDMPPTRRYRDYGIWSPKNEVLIWDFEN